MLCDMLAKLAFCGLDGKAPAPVEHRLEPGRTGRVQTVFVGCCSVRWGIAVVAADAAAGAAAVVAVAVGAAVAAAAAAVSCAGACSRAPLPPPAAADVGSMLNSIKY